MNLVIVESPTKARTISKFLGSDYTIKASMGHVVDLPKSVLGVDTEHDFTPLYEPVPNKKNIVSDLKSSAKSADKVILATDPDREGEAIAFHVREQLWEKNGAEKFKRIVFHEITQEAVNEALKNPRDIDHNLVDAQTARRVLDRLVGYKLSPLLWKKVRRGLSAGRVQSIALRLVVEREREIEKFKSEKYWTIHAYLISREAGSRSAGQKDKKDPTEFELTEINKEKIEKKETFNLYDGEYSVTKTSIALEEAKTIIQKLNGQNYTVQDVSKKETKRSPLPPFTTSTLQQEASRRLSFTARKTMTLAQKLYEEGYITYHRTDSTFVGMPAVLSTRGFVEKEFGKKYLTDKPRFYKTKQKLAQEAHEAIRPTNVRVQSVELGRDHQRVYDLIWRRSVSSQMADSVVESTTVIASVLEYTFKANGSVLLFDGFLKVNPQALSDNILPEFKVGESLTAQRIEEKEHETLPPPRYNDASLIKTLEEKGIGRPSTYATIIDTIQNRQYTEKVEGRFKPTSVGNAVNDFLVENFSTIDDIPFTAEMEDQLDLIAQGEKPWVPIVKSFYGPFEEKVKQTETASRVKIEVEKTDEICPECGSPLIVRVGRFGKFLACSAFPKCRFTKPFMEETNLTCPKDGGKIVIRKTKRGRRFYGCSNYPKCDFAVWKLSEIKKAPTPA